MTFRRFFYLLRVIAMVLPAVLVISFLFAPHSKLMTNIEVVAVCLMIPLALAVVVTSIFMAFGKLRMRCPFCDRAGPVGASKGEGLWMECPSCGLIHGVGILRLRLEKADPSTTVPPLRQPPSKQ